MSLFLGTEKHRADFRGGHRLKCVGLADLPQKMFGAQSCFMMVEPNVQESLE